MDQDPIQDGERLPRGFQREAHVVPVAVDEKTGARLPPKAKPRGGKAPKVAPVADVVDPDEDPQLGEAPQGEPEMSAEEADAALHSGAAEAPEVGPDAA